MKLSQRLLAFLKSHHTVEGSWPEFRLCCPLCHETKYRFGVNVEKQVAHCFRCDVALGKRELFDLLGFNPLPDIHGDPSEAIREILEEKSERKSKPAVSGIEIEGTFMAGAKDHPLYYRAARYLAGRGFDPYHLAETYHLILPDPGSPLDDRVIFPIIEGQEIVYYQARALGRALPKYLNPPKRICPVGKSQFIFNFSQAIQYLGNNPQCERLVICEGIFSALAVGENAVCLFGKEASQTQLNLIFRSGVEKVHVLLDPGAEINALKLAAQLHTRLDVKISFLQGGDPNEVPKDYLAFQLANSHQFDDYFFAQCKIILQKFSGCRI